MEEKTTSRSTRCRGRARGGGRARRGVLVERRQSRAACSRRSAPAGASPLQASLANIGGEVSVYGTWTGAEQDASWRWSQPWVDADRRQGQVHRPA